MNTGFIQHVWRECTLIGDKKFAARPEWSSFSLSLDFILFPNRIGKKAGTEDG